MSYHVDEWLADAKCRDRSDEWDADKIYKPDRKAWAFAQCHDCPVLLACAAGAIRDGAVGVVRAGIMLPYNERYARKQLEALIANGGPAPVMARRSKTEKAIAAWAEARCACCQQKVRPPWAALEDFPGTVGARSKTKCNVCSKHERGQTCPKSLTAA